MPWGKARFRTASKVGSRGSFMPAQPSNVRVDLVNAPLRTDSMKQTTITDNKEVNDVQGGLGETVGGQFGSDGIAGGLGKGLSKAL